MIAVARKLRAAASPLDTGLFSLVIFGALARYSLQARRSRYREIPRIIALLLWMIERHSKTSAVAIRRWFPWGGTVWYFCVVVMWMETKSEFGGRITDGGPARSGLLSILLSTLRSNGTVLDRLNGQYGLRPETVKSLLDS